MTAPAYSILFSAPLAATVASGSVGDVLIPSDDPDDEGRYVKATTANRGTRRSVGIALAPYSAQGSVSLQQNGLISAVVSGLDAGDEAYVRCSATGRLERIGTPSASDDVVGRAHADGTVHLWFGAFPNSWTGTAGGGSGKTIVAMADADQSIAGSDARIGIVQLTGTNTAKRTLTILPPDDDASSFQATILNVCAASGSTVDAGTVTLSVGTGGELDIEPGSKSLVQVTPDGVFPVLDLPLDPRDFGCPWDGSGDDLPGLVLMQQAIPYTRTRKTVVQLPKGEGWCSDNLEIFRKLEVWGHGKAYQPGTLSLINGLRFPPLKGAIVHADTSAADLVESGGAGGAHNTSFQGVNIKCMGSIVSDASGNFGRAMCHIDTTYDVWERLPDTVRKGSVCIKSGVAGAAVTVGSSIVDYYSDGLARSTTHLVWFRCTVEGTKGSAKPTLMASATAATMADLGTTITATSGTAQWVVESIPKDYANGAAVKVGQRVFLPGDNSHVFICTALNGATTMAAGESTTIALASNGVGPLATGTINVADTTGFPATGIIRVTTTTGFQFVTYTGKTGTTFTGCTVVPKCATPSGTMVTGGAVKGPFKWAAWGIPVMSLSVQMHQPAHRGEFYDVGTVTSGSHTFATGTVTVTSTAGFANSGNLKIWTGSAYTTVAYTGRTATTFTGCTGGTGTAASGSEVGQGCFWQQEHSGALTVLASWCSFTDGQICGATNGAVWISATYKRTVSGGSHYFAFRNNYVTSCGMGYTATGSDSNGSETEHNQFDFMGAGRTNVDGPNYLNIISSVSAGTWANGRHGNAGESIQDRVIGLNRHSNNYTQFSGGKAYRNDTYSSAVPGGNNTIWDQCATENDLLPIWETPALVTNPPHGAAQKTTATIVSGSTSRSIRTSAPLVTDSTKTVQSIVGAQSANLANVLQFQHSDDVYPVSIRASEDMPLYPAKWWLFGKGENTGWFNEQFFAMPRPGASALLPGAHSLGGLTPVWFTQDRILLGREPGSVPCMLGFAAASPASAFSEYIPVGSLHFNNAWTPATLPFGWICTVGGTPGTQQPVYVAKNGEVTIAMADANKTPTAAQCAFRTIVLTGALTADRRLFLPVPAANADGAEHVVDASGVTTHDIIVDLVGSVGTTVTVAAGKTATIRTNTGGVKRQTGDI